MDYGQRTDQEVVALARKGRESAYRELIDRYQRPVFSLVHRLVRDHELAEDLAQESFIKVFNALDRYDPNHKFSSWIFRIAHNTSIDRLRKRELETLSIDGSPHAVTEDAIQATTIVPTSRSENPEEFTSSREIGRKIEEAIGTLRPEYRTVILLWHVEGRPYDEIAEIMELPLGTVKTYIHRARNELRKKLAYLRT